MAAGAVSRALLAIALLGTAACAAAQQTDPIFRDAFEIAPPPSSTGSFAFENVTAARLEPAPDSSYRFDAVWNDFNGDGCYDAFVFDHASPATSRLWANRCDGTHRFAYVDNTQARHYIANPSHVLGAGWMTLLDFNGDGRQDFFLRHAAAAAGRYLNATSGAGALPYFGEKQFGCDNACVFADINGDGELDIINADRRVERMLTRTLLMPAAGPSGERVVGDVDNDGWPDLVQPEHGGWWRNSGGTLSWRAVPIAGGLDIAVLADFDNDGDLDLFSLDGDWSQNSGRALLYANDGRGGFSDVSATSGLSTLAFQAYWTSYGNAIAADFDNDGLQDLLVAGSGYDPSVALWRNVGGLRFQRVNVALGPATSGAQAAKSRASVADFDLDGRIDILKTQDRSNAGVWRNTTGGTARWMKLRVRGPGLNSDGVGTVARWYSAGTQTLLAHREVQLGVMHPQTWLHVGLGAASRVDLVVRYPHGGPSFTFRDLAVDQEVIVYPNGCLLQDWRPGNGWPLEAPAGCR